MDLHNNEVGFEIGRTAKENGYSKGDIPALVITAINQGKGKTIN
jgi:hypothetical protein